MPGLLLTLIIVLLGADHSVIHGSKCGIALLGLDNLVDALEVAVMIGTLPPGWWGAYHAHSRTVTMRGGLSVPQFRSVLAHELGHAHLRHDGGYSRHDSDYERAADLFAARQLITVESAREALTVCGPDTDALASYLRVMPWVVREYGRTPEGRSVISDYTQLTGEGAVPRCVLDAANGRTLMEVTKGLNLR